VNLYGRLFARLYDRAVAASEAAGFADRRRVLLAQARGRALEIGAGTGLNLDYYPPDLEQLVLTDPEEPMLRRLRARVADRHPTATVVAAPAERLPFPDASFDTVATTLALCTVGDLATALGEVRRVLAPGGRLLFLEHVRASDERLARWQDRLHPLWRRLAHGCHCNRATLAAIEAAALDVRDVEHGRMPRALRIVEPLVVGVAVKPNWPARTPSSAPQPPRGQFPEARIGRALSAPPRQPRTYFCARLGRRVVDGRHTTCPDPIDRPTGLCGSFNTRRTELMLILLP
jgi:SAM-dependent methyltransferase